MTGKEIVRASLYFKAPERYASDFPAKYGSDFYMCGMDPHPDAARSNGIDEWGCVWSRFTKVSIIGVMISNSFDKGEGLCVQRI
jgi:hypothetical protein